ncbi:carbohydrate ABC transporter permease [Kribbella sp. NPDC051586]|uniref:carbohydrate ABC transporter permease n=1 Tax=Kribbella sp. NPDC051586 TaxID=3364118 RepID=UPI00378B15DE
MSRTKEQTVDLPRLARPARISTARRRPSVTSSGPWPLVFVGPLMAGIAVFYLWPVARTIYFSFTKWGVFGGARWIGLENYRRLASDPEIGRALLNTVVYTCIALVGVPIALLLADLMSRPGLRCRQVYRALYFLPYITMPVAIAMIWRIIYNGDFGVLNWVLGRFGVPAQHWLSTEWLALVCVAVVGVWMEVGFYVIIFSAAMNAIPADVNEAAALDGAGSWRRFRSITVPLLTPSIFFVTVITVIAGFQVFDLLFVLLGPSNPVTAQTQSLVYLFYSDAFVSNDKGYGAAVAVVILAIVGLVTVVQFRLQRKWVQYG